MKMNKSKFILVLYLITVITLTLVPFNSKALFYQKRIIFLRIDYLIHICMFIPWAALNKVFSNAFNIFHTVFYGVIMAIIMELIHYMLPYRSFNIYDLIANLIGILLGIPITRLIKVQRQ